MNSNLDNFVTVKTFSYPHEVAVIRARLESEGIECFVKDELTIQVQPFYSNAIGGVKLQVKESDLAQTIEILKETGYLQ
jgi:type III secretory pathway lipoprotein EscJ